MELDPTSNQWSARVRGYPHLVVRVNCMGLFLEFYEKFTEINHINFRLTANIQYEEQENGIILKQGDNAIAISFKKISNVEKFLSIFKGYIQIQKNYLKIFKDAMGNIQTKLEYFEYFIEEFDVSEDFKTQNTFLPFIHLLLKEQYVFQHVFENMFYQYYSLFRSQRSFAS